jgi:hypothetical protein
LKKLPFKIVVVLEENLSCGIALNTTAHMLAKLGSLVPEMMGKSPKDKSGIVHSGIPQYPNIVLKASSRRIKEIIRKARENSQITIADYPKVGLDTYADEEYCQAIESEREEKMIYYGAALFGKVKDLNKLTGDLKLWR